MVKRVADESARGCVYAINIRNDALENTSSLLEDSLNPLQVPLSTVPFFFFFSLYGKKQIVHLLFLVRHPAIFG